jgi:hypothetical protein
VIHLLHARLLFGLLSSLCMSGIAGAANAPEQPAAHGYECGLRGLPTVVLSLREARQNKVDIGPKHAPRVLLADLRAEELPPDHDEGTQCSRAESCFYPFSMLAHFPWPTVPSLRTPEQQLERPPRA